MKAIPCKLILNTTSGYIATPIDFPSISKAVSYAKDSCYFAYRIFVNNKCVKQGFCD